MQEMSLLPLSILSNASACPSRTRAGRTAGGFDRAVMPRPAVNSLTSAATACISVLDDESAGVLSGAVELSSPQPNRAKIAPDAASLATHVLRSIALIPLQLLFGVEVSLELLCSAGI